MYLRFWTLSTKKKYFTPPPGLGGIYRLFPSPTPTPSCSYTLVSRISVQALISVQGPAGWNFDKNQISVQGGILMNILECRVKKGIFFHNKRDSWKFTYSVQIYPVSFKWILYVRSEQICRLLDSFSQNFSRLGKNIWQKSLKVQKNR